MQDIQSPLDFSLAVYRRDLYGRDAGQDRVFAALELMLDFLGSKFQSFASRGSNGLAELVRGVAIRILAPSPQAYTELLNSPPAITRFCNFVSQSCVYSYMYCIDWQAFA